MNSIDKYGDAHVIRAFITRNFEELGYEFEDDVLTYLKGYAFAGATDLKRISLPSIEVISDACFLETVVSESFEIPWKSIKQIESAAFAFSNVIKESSLILENVTTIGSGAFYKASGISSVTADKWTEIGHSNRMVVSSSAGIFEGSSLQSISAPVLSKFRSDQNAMFKDCKSLISVSLPVYDDQTEDMFSGCSAMTEISLPALTEIGMDNTFYYCSSLEKVSLPEVASIAGSNTFWSCTSLKEVSAPKLKGKLGDGSFERCYALTSINLQYITELGERSFYGCKLLTSDNLYIPNVRKIGRSCFESCDKFTEEKFNLIEEIGEDGFSDCDNMTSIELSKASVIGQRCFYNCRLLRKVVIGGDIKEFDNGTFWNCQVLETLVLSGITSVPVMNERTFGQTSVMNSGDGIVYVPDALVDSFKADASWSKFNIQALSTYKEVNSNE